MAMRRTNWSVIIVGRWNRSILTPAGIAKRIFGLKDLQQLMVAVPLDGVSPFQVKHPVQNIVVSTEEARLRIHLDKQNYDSLALAMAAGVNALTSLPETPVSAAGFNVDFHTPEAVPSLAQILQTTVDARLGDLGHEVLARSVGRSVHFGEGKLNIAFLGEEDDFRLTCNFHMVSSDVEELKQWLKTPINDVRTTINRLLETFDLDVEENQDATNRESPA